MFWKKEGVRCGHTEKFFADAELVKQFLPDLIEIGRDWEEIITSLNKKTQDSLDLK